MENNNHGKAHDGTPMLSLPPEILVHEIFFDLPFLSLLSLRAVCRLFRDLVDHDPFLAYRMELKIAGLRDNQFCSYLTCPVAKRLEALREHERKWHEMKPEWTRTVSFPASFTFSGSVITKSGALIIYGGEEAYWKNGPAVLSDLIFSRLPSTKDAELEWEELDFRLDEKRSICGFGHAFRSYDLCAYVTRSPNEERLPTGTMYINLYLGASTQPHPLAALPIIEVPLARQTGIADSWLVVAVDIDGENLIVITSHQETNNDPFESFVAIIYALNWRTGQLITTFSLPIGRWTLSGLLLLKDQDWLLWPDEQHNSLDVYYFSPLSNPSPELMTPSSSSSSKLPHRSDADLVLRLELPPIKPGVAVFFIDTGSFPGVPCRVGPASRKLEANLGPFDADRSIIYYMVEYVPVGFVDAEGYYNSDNVVGFSIFIDREVVHDLTLKALKRREEGKQRAMARQRRQSSTTTAEGETEDGSTTSEEDDSDTSPLVIPWDDWGPQSTRWIESQGEAWISTAYDRGARLITPPKDSPPTSWVNQIEVFDFAALRVAKRASQDPNGVVAPLGPVQEEDRAKLVPSQTTYYLRDSPTVSPTDPRGGSDPFVKPVYSHLPYSRTVYDGRMPNDFLNSPEGDDWECAGVEICKDRIIGIMRQMENGNLIDAFNIIQIV